MPESISRRSGTVTVTSASVGGLRFRVPVQGGGTEGWPGWPGSLPEQRGLPHGLNIWAGEPFSAVWLLEGESSHPYATRAASPLVAMRNPP